VKYKFQFDTAPFEVQKGGSLNSDPSSGIGTSLLRATLEIY